MPKDIAACNASGSAFRLQLHGGDGNNGGIYRRRNPSELRHNSSRNGTGRSSVNMEATATTTAGLLIMPPKGAAFANLTTVGDVVGIGRRHPLPCGFAVCMLFFMGVEYTIRMVPFNAPPVDVGFVFTRSMHGFIAARPVLNSILAAHNTVFVLMQTTYILWTLLVEGRPRPTIAAIFMFTSRGILGCSTQLPLPQDFLGSGMDFPVGNVSFFLFFSGHVAGAVIAALDMRRMRRRRMARGFNALNVLQGLRLLATRGHYTIDLAVGVGAGILFDSFAGKYERSKNRVGGNTSRRRDGRAAAAAAAAGGDEWTSSESRERLLYWLMH